MPRHKHASNDGKEVPSSVAASSVNTDDMKSPVPTTRANRSANKEKCEVEDVFTAVQRKGRRPQETEPSERLLSANNDVTGNCDRRTKRNGNPPAPSKPKKRRIFNILFQHSFLHILQFPTCLEIFNMFSTHPEIFNIVLNMHYSFQQVLKF